jgi:hypothetical protein
MVTVSIDISKKSQINSQRTIFGKHDVEDAASKH